MKKLIYFSLSLTAFVFPWAANAVEWPEDEFTELNYGLYWFGYDENWQKAEPGVDNAYYDPNRKTLLFAHGWKEDSTIAEARETMNRAPHAGPDLDLAAYWLNEGYNVGFLYWNQFSDEAEVEDAEAKIWSPDGPRDMRWKRLIRNSNGSVDVAYEYLDTDKSVAELLLDEIRLNMADFNGEELRMTGHSLGNQVAIVLSHYLLGDVQAGLLPETMLPDRLVLLDPFYSNGDKDYLDGDWTGEWSRWLVDDLIAADVAVEFYRSSFVTSTIFTGDENKDLIDKVTFVELVSDYFSIFQWSEKHHVAVWWYFWSFAFEPPAIYNSNEEGISASTSLERVKEMMGDRYGLDHRSGTDTQDPNDDVFEYDSK